jgi:hypothetical protein
VIISVKNWEKLYKKIVLRRKFPQLSFVFYHCTEQESRDREEITTITSLLFITGKKTTKLFSSVERFIARLHLSTTALSKSLVIVKKSHRLRGHWSEMGKTTTELFSIKRCHYRFRPSSTLCQEHKPRDCENITRILLLTREDDEEIVLRRKGKISIGKLCNVDWKNITSP